MKHAAAGAAPNPFDVRAMWDVNSGMLGSGDKAYRAWLDGASRMQSEATAFWNGRLGKDVEVLSALGQCANPGEALEVQMKYARDAMADYYEEGQRMMRLMNEVALESGVSVAGSARRAGMAP